MWKLIKLEWKKNNIRKYAVKAAISVLILLVMILAVSGELEGEETVELYGKDMISAAVGMFSNMTFMLMTGVMLSVYIVTSYRDGTMALMFSYPIKRRKILMSKMLAVWIFGVIALVLCKLFLYIGLFLASPWIPISSLGILSGDIFTKPFFYLDILMNSAVMISISYTVLLVGIKTKSSKATIIAELFVIILTQGNIGPYTLFNNIPFYVLLAALASAAVFLCLYRAEIKDT